MGKEKTVPKKALQTTLIPGCRLTFLGDSTGVVQIFSSGGKEISRF